MVPSVPQPGDVVAGKYEIKRLLGKGGMGVVIEAHHKKLGTRVAIKFLMPDALTSHDGVARFDREARASALLRSPYVVRVLDIDATAEGLPFIVMEFLEGVDLGSEIRRRGIIPLSEAIDWVLQACIGLAEAHARGIVHRDIKPANLYLCTEPTGPIVKVMDFGISKLLAGHGEVDLTTTETTVGTPNYMAPEQLLSSKSTDHRADVWALGVVLYRMLAGSFPFAGSSPTALAIAIATEPPVSLASVAPSVPAGVVSAIMCALEKSPSNRHADVVAFGRALEPFGTKRVGFLAAVARMPPPHAAGSSGRLPRAEESTRGVSDAAPNETDETNARTENAWAHRASATALEPRRRAWPIALGVLGLIVTLVGTLAVWTAFKSKQSLRTTASALPSVPSPSGEGAFAPPPASPEPAVDNEPASPASGGLAAAAASSAARPRVVPSRPAASTPKPSRATPSAAVPEKDPSYL